MVVREPQSAPCAVSAEWPAGPPPVDRSPPESLRDRVALRPGVVDVFVDGAGLGGEARAGDDAEERDGRRFVPRAGVAIDDETVRGLRYADQPWSSLVAGG